MFVEKVGKDQIVCIDDLQKQFGPVQNVIGVLSGMAKDVSLTFTMDGHKYIK